MVAGKIGAVAARFDVSPRRLVEFERLGLLHPEREPCTHDRVYSATDVEIIRRILWLLHRQRFSLAAIRTLFRCAPCFLVRVCRHAQSCAIAANPHVPCYEQRAAGVKPAETGCECASCAKYLCREQPTPFAHSDACAEQVCPVESPYRQDQVTGA